jgi:N6-adenosine-specific RNA methylase IME4
MNCTTPELTAHPAAESFPMMDPDRLQQLTESIASTGLQVPILLCDGQILDGRNRYAACREAGVQPRFEEFAGGNPFEHVWALNGQRRDLEAGQRAAIRLMIDRASSEWEAEQQARREAANARRAEATREQVASQPRDGYGRIATSTDPTKPGGISHDIPPGEKPVKEHPGAEQLAARAAVSEATAARTQALGNKRPDLLAKVASGEVKLTEATRQAKRDELADFTPAMPTGRYRVLYADPPWKYGDSRGLDGYAGTAADDHYPTMSVADLSALPVADLAEPDAVLFCWATFPLLPDALAVVKAWGFAYKTAIVWDKGHGPFGHYHNAAAELLLICIRGSCQPDSDKKVDQVQEVKRPGPHSAKPEEFRQLIDIMYHGSKIELFRRGAAPDGWAVWGNEVAS